MITAVIMYIVPVDTEQVTVIVSKKMITQ